MEKFDGFFLIDKAKGVSSFDVIRELRKITGIKKMGHSGTLDPLATGLLLVAVGEGTKLLEFLIGADKEYEVEVEFGKVSNSYDADGEISVVEFDEELTGENIEQEIETSFLGLIEQVPPKYSALKIGGKRACDIVRGGGEVEMKSRDVLIKYFELEELNWPFARFKIGCGSGTYIRSLVHDLGEVLKCGAYVKELRRTEIGEFDVDDAVKNQELEGDWATKLNELEDLIVEFDKLDLNLSQYEILRNGRKISFESLGKSFPLMAFLNGKLVGVLEEFEGGLKFRKQILVKKN